MRTVFIYTDLVNQYIQYYAKVVYCDPKPKSWTKLVHLFDSTCFAGCTIYLRYIVHVNYTQQMNVAIARVITSDCLSKNMFNPS